MDQHCAESCSRVPDVALRRIGYWVGEFQESLCRAVLSIPIDGQDANAISSEEVDLAVMHVCSQIMVRQGAAIVSPTQVEKVKGVA